MLDLVRAGLGVLAVPAALSGCFGPPALESAVLGYDETTAELEQKLLLLNIARWDAGLPVHFTTTSSIAATFDWTSSAGIGGQINEGRGNVFDWSLSASGSENPTFSITPITGEAFTKRVLRPLRDEVFNSIIFQGDRFDQTVRLMADGFEFQHPDCSFDRFVANNPAKPRDYEEFRRLIDHLQWLYGRNELFVRTLVYEDTIVEHFEAPTARAINEAHDRGMIWRQKEDGGYRLTNLTAGRVVVTNYDPSAMSHRERREFNDRISFNPPSFLYVHVRSDGPGGELPIHGALSLRSLVRTLDFVAAGIERHPEYEVAPDPRTGSFVPGAATALRIVTDAAEAAPNSTSVHYDGKTYHVADSDWDRRSFRILTWLFQAALGDVDPVGIPITIAK